MIGKNMFVGEPTINDYREISLEDVLKEHLYFKGTYDERNVRHNAVYVVSLTARVRSG